MKVVKFGGTSLASASQIKKCADIIHADAQRRYVVVSAPGKRTPDDTKVTDLLIQAHHQAHNHKDYQDTLQLIYDRFAEIVNQLGVSFNLISEFEMIQDHLAHQNQLPYLASRGEYLNAKIIAKYLGYTYVEAQDYIYFDLRHRLLAKKTYERLGQYLKTLPNAVIGGFYGCQPNGEVDTFTRGGSDVTGAIVARSVQADLYENWTDVNGFRTADPRIVKNSKGISWISFKELRELSYMGASVLHEDAVFPLRGLNIPLHIRNTNEPENPGTIISNDATKQRSHVVAGIAGKKGLSNLQIEKEMMNTQVGFGARVLEIIAKFGVSYEHTPTSIDTMSVIVESEDVEHCRNELLQKIQSECKPDKLFLQDHIALIAVVGEGMQHQFGVAAKIFQTLADHHINIRMIDVGFSEMNIIIGVNEDEYEKSITYIYEGIYEYL